jgi:D-3-phosphoglycerate dehydrogenase
MKRVGLTSLLEQSDFVVCLALANAGTDDLINEAAFAAIKPTAYFINLARGTLVDDSALEAALRNGRIAGAALDVGNEPGQMPKLALAKLPNVIATPHIGGLTQQAAEGQALETVGQVAEILQGRIPHNALNAESASRFDVWKSRSF